MRPERAPSTTDRIVSSSWIRPTKPWLWPVPADVATLAVWHRTVATSPGYEGVWGQV